MLAESPMWAAKAHFYPPEGPGADLLRRVGDNVSRPPPLIGSRPNLVKRYIEYGKCHLRGRVGRDA